MQSLSGPQVCGRGKEEAGYGCDDMPYHGSIAGPLGVSKHKSQKPQP